MTARSGPPPSPIGPGRAGWRLAFWIGGVVVALVLLDALSDILLPFVAGMAIAYLFDPVADRLEDWGVGRSLAAAIVIGLFGVVATIAVLLLVPILLGQVETFSRAAPAALEQLRVFFEARLGPIEDLIPDFRTGGGAGPQAEAAAAAVRVFTGAVQKVVGGVLSAANLLSLIFITPIVTFYLLRDWDRIVAQAHDLLPRDASPIVARLLAEIDATLAAFVRGTGVVCLTLGAFYAVALSLAGLNFGVVIGLAAGLISFVPFVGSVVGLVVSVGMALWQFPDLTPVLIVAGIFVVGQAVEGNVLTPKLVGGRVNLHPVWVIFGMLAGGSLFGFVGVMLAVPGAAAAGVLVRYAVERYRDSALYRGDEQDAPAPRSDEAADDA